LEPQIPAGLSVRFVHRMSLTVLLTMEATVKMYGLLLAPISMPDKTSVPPVIVLLVMFASEPASITMAPWAALGTLPKCERPVGLRLLEKIDALIKFTPSSYWAAIGTPPWMRLCEIDAVDPASRKIPPLSPARVGCTTILLRLITMLPSVT